MTKRLSGFGSAEGPLWVLDSSAAIDLKRSDLVPLAQQWDFWDQLLGLVRNGGLLFPSQVRTELTNTSHPDVPGAWAPKAWDVMRDHRAPNDGTVVEVLRQHPDLVDEKSEVDQADSYVVALALEHLRRGNDVHVAATDQNLIAACATFGIPTAVAAEFVCKHQGCDP